MGKFKGKPAQAASINMADAKSNERPMIKRFIDEYVHAIALKMQYLSFC